MNDVYDLIIIGTGAGGGTLAHDLAPSGKSILLLERGGWLPREKQNWSAEDVFVANRYVSKESWLDKEGKPFQPGVHYFVGGATKMYGAALYRLREKDFGEIRHQDGLSPAWPISYADLEPFYARAEALYQVHGVHGEDPTEPPASAPYSYPPVSHEPRIQQLHDDLARGIPPVSRPLRHPARPGEPAVLQMHPLRRLRRLPLPQHRGREPRAHGHGERAAGRRASAAALALRRRTSLRRARRVRRRRIRQPFP